MEKFTTSYDGAGIYALYNIIDNKVYIGKSKNIKQRFAAHVRGFSGLGCDLPMYNDAIDNFTFIVVHKLSEEEYGNFGSVLEHLYMEEAKNNGVSLYNRQISDDIYYKSVLLNAFKTCDHFRGSVNSRCGMMPYYIDYRNGASRRKILQTARERESVE